MKTPNEVKDADRRAREKRLGGYLLGLLVALILVASYFATKLVIQSWVREVLEAGQ